MHTRPSQESSSTIEQPMIGYTLEEELGALGAADGQHPQLALAHETKYMTSDSSLRHVQKKTPNT